MEKSIDTNILRDTGCSLCGKQPYGMCNMFIHMKRDDPERYKQIIDSGVKSIEENEEIAILKELL